MFNRIILFLLVAFWITMNVLLWRTEFGGQGERGRVPVAVVWQKILTAPDSSSLEIRQHGKKIGSCRWLAIIGQEETTNSTATAESELQGRVRQATQYAIGVEGNLAFGEQHRLMRFDFNLSCTTNHDWQDLYFHASQRPRVWELKSEAAAQTLNLRIEDGEGEWERAFTFDELRHPDKLLNEFGAPWLLGMLGGGLGGQNLTNLSLGVAWEAHTDWLQLGAARVRVYRLQARLLDRLQAVVIVSRVGEILRVQLPDDLLLVNDAMTGW